MKIGDLVSVKPCFEMFLGKIGMIVLIEDIILCTAVLVLIDHNTYILSLDDLDAI